MMVLTIEPITWVSCQRAAQFARLPIARITLKGRTKRNALGSGLKIALRENAKGISSKVWEIFVGSAKSAWMERLEDEALEKKAAWIREILADPEADEDTEGWYELSEEYDLTHQDDDRYPYEDDWIVEGKSRIEIFNENMAATREILNQPVSAMHEKNLVVMLFGHVVAAVEAFLSSTFIEYAISSDIYMRRLVENDPEFAKRKFTIKEIFTKREELKSDISEYLKGLIFHDIAKVKPLYASVLEFDFGDAEWLFRAVLLRHHCVHRAGYDKEGKEVALTKKDVTDLIGQSVNLVHAVETALIMRMPVDHEHSFWKDVKS